MLQDALGDKHIAQQSRQQGVHSPFPDPHYHTSRSMGVCTLPDGSCACLRMYRLLSAIHQHLTCGSEVQKHKLTNHASRQTHTAIAHGKPMHRGRQVLNSIRRMQQRRDSNTTGPHSELRRLDGGPGKKTQARRHRGRKRLAGAHSKRCFRQERHNNTQKLQLHVLSGMPARGGNMPANHSWSGSFGHRVECSCWQKHVGSLRIQRLLRVDVNVNLLS